MLKNRGSPYRYRRSYPVQRTAVTSPVRSPACASLAMLTGISAHTPEHPFVVSCGRARCILVNGERILDSSVKQNRVLNRMIGNSNKARTYLCLLQCSPVLPAPGQSFGAALLVNQGRSNPRAFLKQSDIHLILCG